MLNAKELEKSLLAAGHKIVPDTLSKEELRYNNGEKDVVPLGRHMKAASTNLDS